MGFTSPAPRTDRLPSAPRRREAMGERRGERLEEREDEGGGEERHPRRRRILLRIGLVLALLLLIGAAVAAVGAAAIYRKYARGLPEIPTLAEYRPPVVTSLFSADGQLVGELYAERRKVVPYDRIPRQLVQALVASEDKTFFEHHGIDWRGTLRAAWNTYVLRHRVQGGSTITQQTAKSILVSAEGFEAGTRRTLRRKIRELILARRLEAAFDKEQILWLYLNGVYLGHHSYGVASAAENYFRKDVGELTLAEAALLAGLPQAPSKYSPCLTRRRPGSGGATCSAACTRRAPSPPRSARPPTPRR